MSLLSGRKAFEPLQENVIYKAILRGYTEKPAEQPTDTILGFISFRFELPDGRTVTDTRSVPQGTDILARQILEQTHAQNGIDQEELFNQCIQTAVPLDMWVTRRTVDNQSFTNYTFQEPIKPVQPTNQVASDDEFQ